MRFMLKALKWLGSVIVASVCLLTVFSAVAYFSARISMPAHASRWMPPEESPDGKYSARICVGPKKCGLYLRKKGGGEKQVMRLDGGAQGPFWTLDSKRLFVFYLSSRENISCEANGVQVFDLQTGHFGGSYGSVGIAALGSLASAEWFDKNTIILKREEDDRGKALALYRISDTGSGLKIARRVTSGSTSTANTVGFDTD